MRIRALFAGVVLPLLLWSFLPVGTIASDLSSVQDKIEQTQGNIDRKRGSEKVLTTEISGYNHRINALQGDITDLSSKVTTLQADLDRKRAILSRTQSDLRYQRARLVRLKLRFRQAQRVLARRLVEIYQSDQPDLVTVILNSKGFADLLEREEFIHRIGEQDRHIIELVADAKKDAHDTAAHLAVLEKRQRKIAAQVLERRNQIAAARGELVDKRDVFAGARSQRATRLGSIRQERHELEGRLDDLQAEQAKIQNALSAAQGPTLPAGP